MKKTNLPFVLLLALWLLSGGLFAQLTNPSACQLNLAIPDDNCPDPIAFDIDVATAPGTSLGGDVALIGVNVIIAHTWNGDLEISLTSPSGVTVELSSDNGGSTDNYGDPTDPTCSAFTNFDMNGIDGPVTAGDGPFIGSFIPEGNFADFNDGTNPVGIWTLNICDDASGDEGTLEYVELIFGTPPPPMYCSAGPSSTNDSNLENFTLNGDNATSINYTPPCPGITGLDDQTALSVDVTPGQSYMGTVTWGTCGGNYGNSGTIWIDWDQNFAFDTTEVIHTFDDTPVVTENVSFTVPANAPGGATRIRVMQREGTTPPPLDPCDNYTWGSVTDFTINVVMAPPQVCDPPVDISITDTTNVSAVVNFSSAGNSTNIEVTAGGAGMGNSVVHSANGIQSPYTLGGLAGNTTYDVYLQNDCGFDQSDWIGPFSFTTLLTPQISIVDSNGNGLPNISDPCDCNDPDNITDPVTNVVTYFHDFITVVSNPGETWQLTGYNSGQLYDYGLNPLPVGTTLTEVSPGLYRIDVLHENMVGFNADFNRTTNPLATPLTTGNVCDGVACTVSVVPTMGQWATILFALIMLSFGVVYVMRRQMVLAGTGTAPEAFGQPLPFDKNLFGKILAYVMVALAVVFVIAIGAFGYKMTNADVPGSLLAGPLLAYFIHLVVMASDKEG